MAFPTVGSSSSGTVDTASTSWTITYPSSIASGDLLLLFVAQAAFGAPSATGFTVLINSFPGAVLGKVASGSESGTFTLTMPSGQGAWQMFRIPAASWYGGSLSSGTTSNASTGVSAAISSTNVNPPSRSPSWGAADDLWFAIAAALDDNDGSGSFTTYPTNYTNGTTGKSNGAAFSRAAIASARRELNATSDDPSAFNTFGSGNTVMSITLAVRPAAGTTPITPSGGLTPSGALANKVTKALAGSIASAGAMTTASVFGRTFAGSITPSGVLTDVAKKALDGSLTPSASITQLVHKQIVGALTPAGALTKVVSQSYAGEIIPYGGLAPAFRFTVSMEGSIGLSGDMTRVAAKQAAGALTPEGTLERKTSQALAGGVTPSGDLAKKMPRAFDGSLTPDGALAKKMLQALDGSLTPDGALSKNTAKPLAGSLTPDGALTRKTSMTFGGGLTPGGSTSFTFPVSMTGTLVASGDVTLAIQFGLRHDAMVYDTDAIYDTPFYDYDGHAVE